MAYRILVCVAGLAAVAIAGTGLHQGDAAIVALGSVSAVVCAVALMVEE